MSSISTSSLSDTNSDYQDIGPMSPSLSPKIVTQADVHLQPSHVHTHVSKHEIGTQYVKTRSVSCDTDDIELSLKESYGLQPCNVRVVASQTDQGYFTSTPYPNMKSTLRDSGASFTPQVQFRALDSSLPQTPLTENRELHTSDGSYLSYISPGGFSYQPMMGTFNTPGKTTPSQFTASSVAVNIPQTPLRSDTSQLLYTQSMDAGITYIPETPEENIYSFGVRDRLGHQQTNLVNVNRAQGLGQTATNSAHNNIHVQPPSILVKPKGPSVTFDPHLSFQSVPAEGQNRSQWSLNSAAACNSQIFANSHPLPSEPAVAGYPKMGISEHQPRTLMSNDIPLTGLPYLNTDMRYGHPVSNQVSGELSHGFASLNLDSFGQNVNQVSQATSNYESFKQNFNPNTRTLLNSAMPEQINNQTNQSFGVPGSSLSNYTTPAWSSATYTQPQRQFPVIQSAQTPSLITNQNALNPYAVPSIEQRVFGVPGQGKNKILEPDSFDGSEKGPEISEYLIHFEQIALWNNWTPDQKARMLSIKLKGEAQKLLSTLTITQLADYETLRQALVHRFNPKERQLAYRCEFRNRRRQKDENPVEFGSALRRLGRKAYPDTTVEALEVHLVDQYVMGLGSFDLQKHVQLQHPKNLEQAVNLALEYTAICNVNLDKVMKPSLLDSNEEDKVTAVTSLRPLDTYSGEDYEKSITQIIEKVLDRREKVSGVDESNKPYVSTSQRVRSPSPNPDNTARVYGRKRVSFNEQTVPKRNYSPKRIICTYCGKYSHTENFCRIKQAEMEKQNQSEKQPLN